jgi:hypothetical protein
LGKSASHSSNDHAKIADALRRIRTTLRRTELAFEELEHATDGERRVAAMCNVVVYGRTVTFVLQNLRSAATDFNSWYEPWQHEMKEDPLLSYLNELRNEILKEGKERTASNAYVVSMRIPDDIPPAPQNAVRFFIGDRNGGSGWEVQLEDGTTQTIYIKLPEDKVRTWLSFQNLPQEHLGAPIEDDTLENVCMLYVRYLQRIVKAAEDKFGASV